MLNHLHAKIDDLGIGEGTVVAQTAPQCFDISLWQLVSALLVGGRTVLVGQDVVVDVERFVDTLVRDRVGVAQVVPRTWRSWSPTWSGTPARCRTCAVCR